MTQLLTAGAGAVVGALGWLLVGVYIQRRQFERQAKSAGRAVHFELTGNQANIAVAFEHGTFQPLSHSSFDRLLPELATWLPAEEVQTVVDAYAAHAGYQQIQSEPAPAASVRQKVLEHALDVHRAAIAALRRRSFDPGELRRMGLDEAPPQPTRPAEEQADSDWRAVLNQYFDAFNARDEDGLRRVVTDDVVEEYPQSGERIEGLARHLEMLDRYPGGTGRFTKSPPQVFGALEQWGLTQTFTVLHTSGGDGSYTATALARYPDGSDWHVVKLFEIRSGRIRAITSYYAPPFPAPDWRADLVS